MAGAASCLPASSLVRVDFPPVVLLEDFQEIQAFLIVAAVGAQSSRTSSWTRASLAREAAIEACDTRKWGTE
jgi:hypothetical protein